MSRSESRKKLIALCIVILGLAFMAPASVGGQAVTLAYWHHIPKLANDLETRLIHEFEQRNVDMYAHVALIAFADLNTTLLTPMGDSNGDYCGRMPNDPRCPPLP